jgi:hypothetical protein
MKEGKIEEWKEEKKQEFLIDKQVILRIAQPPSISSMPNSKFINELQSTS